MHPIHCPLPPYKPPPALPLLSRPQVVSVYLPHDGHKELREELGELKKHRTLVHQTGRLMPLACMDVRELPAPGPGVLQGGKIMVVCWAYSTLPHSGYDSNVPRSAERDGGGGCSGGDGICPP
jgi:hypothetical protein